MSIIHSVWQFLRRPLHLFTKLTPIKKDGKDTWAIGFIVMLAALYILANMPMFAEYKNIVVAAFMGLQVLWFIFIFTRKEQ